MEFPPSPNIISRRDLLAGLMLPQIYRTWLTAGHEKNAKEAVGLADALIAELDSTPST